eukprot:CAMPEP_0198361310 /NCGR_PEP_ID=MMETSP1450-20131203/141744_1 /TAXON_ID=753684 ORGANISM="Madagascaria erythrocladiodes, Strain CCMP3234" /NCGR_SAMPLE_ID=MMETSP1450 /ASSEMBLY_ACC=CAM_ASM_001115 /LENGTH=50 /DNA_ID=CAMNT_0044068413 /DNA_START=53 /DNA_END=201 /DNA_ORIENTATION=-
MSRRELTESATIRKAMALIGAGGGGGGGGGVPVPASGGVATPAISSGGGT